MPSNSIILYALILVGTYFILKSPKDKDKKDAENKKGEK